MNQRKRWKNLLAVVLCLSMLGGIFSVPVSAGTHGTKTGISVRAAVKNGIVREKGQLYYYENGKKVAKGLVKDGRDYYYFGSQYRALRDGNFDLPAHKMNGLLPGGVYSFDRNAHLKQGVVGEYGEIFYYENGQRQKKGLVKSGGDYYYFGLQYKALRDGNFDLPAHMMNGLLPAGVYSFDRNAHLKQGVVEEYGEIFYYENGQRQKKGLVKSGGDYYYFGLQYKALRNGRFDLPAHMMNGLLPAGRYAFDASGKMILKQGIIREGDDLYYYENDRKVVKGMVFDGQDYYCFGEDYRAFRNGNFSVPEHLTNGLLPAGTYTFDASGKLIRKQGIIREGDDLYYYENDRKVVKGVVLDGQDYYCFGLQYKALRDGNFDLPESLMNGLLPAGIYHFAPDGKMDPTPVGDEFRVPDGTLIYREDFEGVDSSLRDEALIQALGWHIDGKADGAYRDNTAEFRISTKQKGNQRLYIRNNRKGRHDSYLTLLTEQEFGIFTEGSYTYQWDMTYTSASSPNRYITLIGRYGGTSYACFSLRNGGHGSDYLHHRDHWYNYTSYNDMANTRKLLGVDYDPDVQAFRDISLSLRYAVDPSTGHRVFVRVNSPGYPGTGKWTLVSFAPLTGTHSAYCVDEESLGSALGLKIGGRQNGYIDNILVWVGTGDEPPASECPYLTGHENTCTHHSFIGRGDCAEPRHCRFCGYSKEEIPHTFVKVQGSEECYCTVCGVIQSNLTRPDWPFPGLPALDSCSPVYLCGQGVNQPDFPLSEESEMVIRPGTQKPFFYAYTDRLADFGYKMTYDGECDNNCYREFRRNGQTVYIYYTHPTREMRLIVDRNSTSSAADFGYSCPDNGQTVIYQYGLPMAADGVHTKHLCNNGMFYIVKLADSSLFVVDGGSFMQFDEAEKDGLLAFMREITGVKAGEKIRISGWFITHSHTDHLTGFALFLKKYHREVQVERILANFPSLYLDNESVQGQSEEMERFIRRYVRPYIGDVPFLKLHTGQKIQLANATIQVLYTHEDLVNQKTGKTGIGTDYNASSTVIRMDAGGLSCMFTGDVNAVGVNTFLYMYYAPTLKVDIMQAAHHALNAVCNLYDRAKASVVLVPQSPKGAESTPYSRQAMESLRKYADPGMVFFESEGTHGIGCVDGRPALVYERHGVDGGPYTGWGW